jgi:TolB-like protein/Tfp pilus assembly protein PilF
MSTLGSDRGVSLDPEYARKVRAQLDRVLSSSTFGGSAKRVELLRYLVEHGLAGEAGQVNEYAIAVDVLGRPASFDPRIDSIVRTQVGRLREKLKDYYSNEGRQDPIVIDIPLRSYSPSFTVRDPEPLVEPPTPSETVTMPERATRLPVRALVVTSLVTLVVLVGALAIWKARASTEKPVHSLVVLPFQSLSRDKQDEYLADGFTEDLTNLLAQWKEVRVVARTSATQFKGQGVDIREIGRKLNVNAAIEGSFEKEGDHIRVTARMNRTSDGYQLWSKAYDARSKDMLGAEDEIGHAIAEAVRKLDQNVPAPPTPSSTNSPEAHDLYLRASFLLSKRDPESGKQALALLEQAVKIDPKYAKAWVQIADLMFSLLSSQIVPVEEGHERVKTALRKALEADPDDSEARGMLAGLTHSLDWDWPRAESEFKLAIDEGGGARVRSLYGWSLMTVGRFEEAKEQLRIAQDEDPLGTGQRLNEAAIYYLQRRYSDATHLLNNVLEAHPAMSSAHTRLEWFSLAPKDCSTVEAQVTWRERNVPQADGEVDRALLSACRGDVQPVRRYLASTPTEAKLRAPWDTALLSLLSGDKASALAFLEKAADARVSNVLTMKYEPLFEPIRSEARFVALEKRIGIDP